MRTGVPRRLTSSPSRRRVAGISERHSKPVGAYGRNWRINFRKRSVRSVDSRQAIGATAIFVPTAPEGAGSTRSFPPWGYCEADLAVALFYFPRLFPEAVSLFPEASIANSSGEEVLGKRSPREIRARGGAATPRWFLVAPARCETSANRRHSAESPTVGPHIALLGLKKPIGSVVLPSVDRSASTSPITGANLNPCPLKPQAIATFACAGCSPTTKFESADIV